jgi:hypothetical protein
MPSPVRFRLGDLQFVWDPDKAAANMDKHGITFEEAATTWTDPAAIEWLDEAHSDDEDRWLRIASSLRGALLVIWSTERAGRRQVVLRIIGARRANPKERQLYEEEEGNDERR